MARAVEVMLTEAVARAVEVMTVAARVAALMDQVATLIMVVVVLAVLEEGRLVTVHQSRRKPKRLAQSCGIQPIPPIGCLEAMLLLPRTE